MRRVFGQLLCSSVAAALAAGFRVRLRRILAITAGVLGLSGMSPDRAVSNQILVSVGESCSAHL